MFKIFTGEITPYNKYRIDDLKSKYIKQYIKEFSSIKQYLKWIGTVKRPLYDSKILAIINDTDFIRNLSGALNTLEQQSDNKYVDTIWILKDKRIYDVVYTGQIESLNANFREDFKHMVYNDLPSLSKEAYEALLKKIGYSWENYGLYQAELKHANVITAKDVNKIIMSPTVKPATEILSMIIQRERYCLNNHKKLVEKYSLSWVLQFYKEQLDRILEAKLKYCQGDLKMAKIRNSKTLVRYINIIMNTPLTDIYLLKNLIAENPLAIEIYLLGTDAVVRSDYLAYRGV